MINRAKCNLCKDVLESFDEYDVVACKCGEICIWGGAYKLMSRANNYSNFLRVDENGNEIVVHYQEKKDEKTNNNNPTYNPKNITNKELIEMLDAMIKSYENLPQNALLQPITHYDLLSLMLLLSEILKKINRPDPI